MSSFNKAELTKALAIAVRDSREIPMTEAEMAQVVGAMMVAADQAVPSVIYARIALGALHDDPGAMFVLQRKHGGGEYVLLTVEPVSLGKANQMAWQVKEGMERLVADRATVEAMRERREIIN